MKKLLYLLLSIVLVVFIFIFLKNNPKDYKVTYKIKTFEITEKYHKDDKYYSFDIKDGKNKYYYVYDRKYSSNRKLVKDIKVKEKDDYRCLSLDIKREKDLYICKNENKYVDPFVAGIFKNDKSKEVKKYKKISIYNDKYNYYIWNGYGITNILTKESYNFLKKESYDNLLSYKLDEKIIFANYDSSREFNKFFIFDYKSKKIDSWELDKKISFNSYFMGDVDNFIYLFDKKNKVQYKLDINKKDYSITSDSYGGVFYDKEWTNSSYNKLVYNEVKFNKEYLVNYFTSSGILNYRFIGSKQNVICSDKKIDSVIYTDSNAIYYLFEDDLYRYSINKGSELLLTNFEWNFSSINKIFIFD